MNIVLIFLISIFSVSLFFYGKSKTKTISIKDNIKLNALPKFYGYYLVLWCSIPALVFLLVWSLFEPTIIKSIIIETAANQGAVFNDKNEANLIYEKIKAIHLGTYFGDIDSILKGLVFVSSLIAILTTLGIIFSLLFESIKFFSVINIFDYLFGTNWSPQRAFVRDASSITAAEYEELKDAFGFIPLIAGTSFIAFIAMLVAVPVGLFSGIYMAEYASTKVRRVSKPIIEILAGIPTVVYGFFAALTCLLYTSPSPRDPE